MTMVLQTYRLENVEGLNRQETGTNRSSLDKIDPRSKVAVSQEANTCRLLSKMVKADNFCLLFETVTDETTTFLSVFDNGYPNISPLSATFSAHTVKNLLDKSISPLWWSHDEHFSCISISAQRWAVQINSPSPDISGIAFPVTQECGHYGLVVFVGNAMHFDESSLCDVHARCFCIIKNLAYLHTQNCSILPSVTKRELECLKLTADGLTSDDIASRLGISIHTINQYLTSSSRKLNAVNRIHAVAKALRCGLIE